jgi:5-methylcytosine-specific restriction endonuclease McrA
MPRGDPARGRIKAFLIENVGKVVTTYQIAEVAKIKAYARRVRELRDKEGMAIRTDKDREDLKPGEYLLESVECKVPTKGISPKQRNRILERDGYTCQLCGATASDPSTYNPNRKVRLHVDHIKPDSQDGATEDENLRTLCSDCNQGRSNIEAPTESAKNILARIRKLPRKEQLEVLQHLKHSYPDV